ncbi:MAG: phosphatidylinositol mannoside acyltransferase, partial [Acidimicrobiia bacterium]
MDLVTPSYRAASRLACALPGPLVEAVAPALGSLAALRDTDRRRMVERHQRRVDPSLSGPALAARVRAVYRSYARYYGESFRLPSVGAEELDARLTYE